ncbi:unnamed protein product [Adineta ricciae]|uniref:Solute carrier family 12 member 9 n=2 Tax=Adineta ricciae TaxID=249248 RepID=A0A815DNL3_ADIRI|nr:unnamed protein product [Adineta ricciae]
MNAFDHLRTRIQRAFSSSTNTNINSDGQQSYSVSNNHFSSYYRFNLPTNRQTYLETSLHTLHEHENSISQSTTIINSNQSHPEILSNSSKRTLRTIPGVFCPIALSMLAISIFMRIGFVLAHAGVLQTLLQLSLCFVILFCTLLSICSLSTNGAIESGGIYHMISRALGPEFGGAIGVLFFSAQVIGNGQSVAALVEALVDSFGPGSKANIFYSTRWWRFLYGTIINCLSLLTCLLGSWLYSMAAFSIFILVSFVYLMVVISFFIRGPHLVLIPKVNIYAYENEEQIFNKTDHLYGHYTSFNSSTWTGNLYANYTIDYTTGDTTNFVSVFGVLFSSIIGLLSGANRVEWSGLNNPNRSIPTGSISATLYVFIIYIIETLLIAATTDRYTLLNNYLFLQEINIWQPFVIIGIVFAVFSACLSGIIGASRILQALAIDEIFGPLLRWLKRGTTRHGNPVAAVFVTFVLVELTLLIGSLNKIARIVTIFFLLAYFAVNLACLALDLASTPNFRPTFKYFSWHTAVIGAIGSIIMCFVVSTTLASIAIGILTGLIAILHLRDFPEASWGSISQALIFHQVRKYLLLLDPRKEHVKFWRPQILLLVSNPRSTINLIDCVNDMKKGGLFILGHVKTSADDDIDDSCSREYPHWISLIKQMKFKAFVNMTAAANIRDGVMHLMRLSGLGGLRPNTVILGFYDDTVPEDKLNSRSFAKRRWLKTNLSVFQRQRSTSSNIYQNSESSSPSDIYSTLQFAKLREEDEEKQLDILTYVQIVKDALHLNKSVCLARNFIHLQKDNLESNERKSFIDIWPVNFIFPKTSTQFDITCLYMFQLATILSMVKPWKTHTILRVFLCIDAVNENALHAHYYLDELLKQLRIKAQTRMISWENVTSLLHNYTSELVASVTTNSTEQQSTTAAVASDSFVDVNDEYIRGINELIRQQSDNTSCLYLYLPRPPRDRRLSQRYMQVLDMLSKDLPPTMFVHGVSSVTCTRL